jgi:type II secretory pathway pseudopilin PulG
VTLVEILVTLSVCGLLMALSLPAVTQVREGARTVQCRQRLQELARAAHNFHADHGTLPYENAPAHFVHHWNPGCLSAWTQLLPYVDQSSLFATINWNESGLGVGAGPPTSTDNPTALKTRLALLLCPADRVLGAGVSFRTCQGTATLSAPTVENPPGIGRPGACYSMGGNRRRAPLSAITDGLSNTVLYSEKIGGDHDPEFFTPGRDVLATASTSLEEFDQISNFPAICQATAQASAPHFSYSGSSWLFCGYAHTWYNHVLTPNHRVPDCTQGDIVIFQGPTTASSWHRGGVNAVLADGSARLIAEAIDPAVWRALGTRSHADVVDP